MPSVSRQQELVDAELDDAPRAGLGAELVDDEAASTAAPPAPERSSAQPLWTRSGDTPRANPDAVPDEDFVPAPEHPDRVKVLDWARALPRTGAAALPVNATTLPQLKVHHVLSLQGSAASLRSVRMKRLADGSLQSMEAVHWARELANPTASVLDDAERLLWPWLQREEVRDGAIALRGAGAIHAVKALAALGRLHLEQLPAHVDTQTMQTGAERAARLQWFEREGGVQLGIEIAEAQIAGSGAVAVAAASPFYVDPEQGTVGPLALDAEESVLNWVHDAPVIDEALAPEVAVALQARQYRSGAQTLIPPLPGQQVHERKGTPIPVVGVFAAGAFVVVSMAVEYEGRRIDPLRVPVLESRQGARVSLVLCDTEAERRLVERLREGLNEAALDTPGYQPGGSDTNRSLRSGWMTLGAVPAGSVGAARVAHELLPLLKSEGWVVADRSGEPIRVVEAGRIRVHADTVDDADSSTAAIVAGTRKRRKPAAGAPQWFGLQVGMRAGEHEIDLAPVLAGVVACGSYERWAKRHCPRGQLWISLSADTVARVDAGRIEPLARVLAEWAQVRAQAQGERDERSERGEKAEQGARTPEEEAWQRHQSNQMSIDRFAAANLAARLKEQQLQAGLRGAGSRGAGVWKPEDDSLANIEIDLPESVVALEASLRGFERVPTAAVSPDFRATLRPYQQHGLDWLQFIASIGLGGVLADDMGLGKTVQMLAHLDLERASGRMKSPVLVVAPTSLVFNWMREAATHAPALRVLELTGPRRAELVDTIDQYDLVITSYALLARDGDVLTPRNWHAVVLDEAQAIKNPKTRAATVAHSLQAGHRIALTGTPLENHLGELWSLMQFIVPGLFGSEEQFRQRFRVPIEREPDGELARERLAALERRMSMFLLRRTKDAVLDDLPGLTEIVHRIELGTRQRDFYESIRVMMDERVRDAMREMAPEQNRIVMLDALLKLRQSCCDPQLVKLPGAATVHESAKREALLDLLRTLCEEGRKVLVFSQFTSMLDLIEEAIDADGELASLKRSRLDGSTADRAAEVERFQQGDAQIFLLSLKAGGVGLNLTAADTVIHYDPWWNPSAERQATDRAHRIGQKRAVFVYKLIAAGTVEERIEDLQLRKAGLAQSVLSGAIPDAAALDPAELLKLFDPL